MDNVTLVEDQIENGQRLLDRLAQDRFPVTAACWAKTSEDGQWYLYIATPAVNRDGGQKAYRHIHTVIQHMPPPFWIHLFDIKLIDKDHPITRGVLDFHRRYPGRSPTRYSGDQLGDMIIDGAYIYAPVTVPKAQETA